MKLFIASAFLLFSAAAQDVPTEPPFFTLPPAQAPAQSKAPAQTTAPTGAPVPVTEAEEPSAHHQWKNHPSHPWQSLSPPQHQRRRPPVRHPPAHQSRHHPHQQPPNYQRPRPPSHPHQFNQISQLHRICHLIPHPIPHPNFHRV